ncbi:MAG: conserved rane protein of unknown function [Candidatus Saccharibacteria bacterium]|nr:conserved rane protein of unknown function [Candidatus Saccharibacteria bacterium]
MPTRKKTAPKKLTKVAKVTKKEVVKNDKAKKIILPLPVVRLWRKLSRPTTTKVKKLLARRPHRSFRLTKRRDYKRSFTLPGYWSFTNVVRATLWKNWKLFGGLALVYIILSIIISGIGAQDSYANLSSALQQTSGDLFKGNFGSVGQAGLLLFTSVTTGLSPNLTQAQSVLGGLVFFYAWLASIWLLRNTLAGNKPRLRDGLYNSGSPILATIAVGLIVVLQLLPASIAVIIYSAAETSGLLEGGVSAMLVWSSVILLGLLSLYWITSSFIALVIVTLPGMYPMQAIRTAGDLVVGRRTRVLFRLAWLILIIALAWIIIIIPIILFDSWLKQIVPAISWLPLVPLSIMALGSITLIFTTSYIYLLYRRIVDDDAGPS